MEAHPSGHDVAPPLVATQTDWDAAIVGRSDIGRGGGPKYLSE